MSLLAASDGLLDAVLQHCSLIPLDLSELALEVKERVASGVGEGELLLETTSIAVRRRFRILHGRHLWGEGEGKVSTRIERSEREQAQTYDVLELADPLLGGLLLPSENVVGCLEGGDLELKVVDLLPDAALGLGFVALMALLSGGELGASLLEFGLRK